MMNSVLVDTEFMSNVFKFNPELLSTFPKNQTFEEMFHNPEFVNLDTFSVDQYESNSSLEKPSNFVDRHETLSFDQFQSKPNNLVDHKTHSVEQNDCNISSSEIPDFPDDCLKFISDILLEEGLDENPASTKEYIALQATEKSLYDALGESYPYLTPTDYISSSLDQNVETPDYDSSHKSYDSVPEIDSHPTTESSFESKLELNQLQLDSLSVDDLAHSFLDLNRQSSGSSCDDSKDGLVKPSVRKLAARAQDKGDIKPVKGVKRKKSRQRDEVDHKGRSNKFQAISNEDYEEMEKYDDVLLCPQNVYEGTSIEAPVSAARDTKVRKNHAKKQQKSQEDHVDLRVLLTQCAQAVSSFDLRSANELLKQIRQHCSPYGDSIQRIAHHIALGLEARMAGTGSTISSDVVDMKISFSDSLKAYKLYVSAIPFMRMSFYVANSSILKLAENATKIHIIDFGVFLGLQWPCLIQTLSKREGGPPQLRITGIDFPQQGFRPAERVDATGRRLSGYCERFGVPFQYQGIADKWENIRPEDLKIESDELVIVNCMHRAGTLLDETVDVNSPRDAFLRLVKDLNPALFVHGILNGTFNAPFFITRFREALHHYSSWFEVFEANLPREAHERLLIEGEKYGKEVYNVIACEGAERVHRPETYRQWQVRQARAGLRQLPLDRELVSRAKAMVKANYHSDFLVDEDKHWMLQGWKGRIQIALSLWRPS